MFSIRAAFDSITTLGMSYPTSAYKKIVNLCSSTKQEDEEIIVNANDILKKMVRNFAKSHPKSFEEQKANNPQIKIKKSELLASAKEQRKSIPKNAQIFGMAFFATSISGLEIFPGDLLQGARKKDADIENKPPADFQRAIWNECSASIKVKTKENFYKKNKINSEELTNIQEIRLLCQTIWNQFVPYLIFHACAPGLDKLIPKIVNFVLSETIFLSKNHAKDIQNNYSNILKQLLITYSKLSQTSPAEELNTKMKKEFVDTLEGDATFEKILETFLRDFRKDLPVKMLLDVFIGELIKSNLTFQFILGWCLYPIQMLCSLNILNSYIEKSIDKLQSSVFDDIKAKKSSLINVLYEYLAPVLLEDSVLQDAKTWQLTEETTIDRDSIPYLLEKVKKFSLPTLEKLHASYETLKEQYGCTKDLIFIETIASKIFDKANGTYSFFYSYGQQESRISRVSKWLPGLVEKAFDQALSVYDNPLNSAKLELTLYHVLNNTLLRGIHNKDQIIKEEYKIEMEKFIDGFIQTYLDPLFQVKNPKQLKEKERAFIREMRQLFSLQDQSQFKTLREKCELIATHQGDVENIFKEAEESLFPMLLSHQSLIKSQNAIAAKKFNPVSSNLLRIAELLKSRDPENTDKLLHLIDRTSEFTREQKPSDYENPNTLKMLFLTQFVFWPLSAPVALSLAATNEFINARYNKNITSPFVNIAPNILKRSSDFVCSRFNEKQLQEVDKIGSTVFACLKTLVNTSSSVLGYIEKSIRRIPHYAISSLPIKKFVLEKVESSIDKQDKNAFSIYLAATVVLREVLNKEITP